MPHPASDKSRICALAMTILALLTGGCAGDKANSAAPSKNSSASAAGSKPGARTKKNIADGDYYNSSWLASNGLDSADSAPPASNAAPVVRNSHGMPLDSSAMSHKSPETTALPPPADVGSRVASNAAADAAVPPLPSAAAQQPTKSVWALVLGTFTEGDTNAAALKMISEVQKIAPTVNGMHAFPTAKGSMVIFGEYTGRDDKQARDDIAWLKSLKFQDRPVFPRVMLTQLDLRPLQPELHPWDLRSARREHPKVHPLYTIDVAMWDDFGSGKISYDEIRRDAENYTAQLRTRGFEAYFYHDDVAQRSMVTVGLFDHHAINEISGLFSDDVMAIMKSIPERLVNGEPMGELKDRFRPQMGIKSQTPVLAEVPDM